MVTTEERAQQSQGSSSPAIYEMVARALSQQHQGGGTVIDVGCGQGNLWHYIHQNCDRYLGVDVLKYQGFPEQAEFLAQNMDDGQVPLPDGSADVVISVETIEHVENPRAFMRELVRLAKPGGLVLVTTPNQLSFLSKLTLVLKNQFNAFQDAPGLYPAHITALLEIDLIRIAKECGLAQITIDYSNKGRLPLSSSHWQTLFPAKGRAFSDNLICLGRKPVH
jgi:SAM-dependent methyltransferase